MLKRLVVPLLLVMLGALASCDLVDSPSAEREVPTYRVTAGGLSQAQVLANAAPWAGVWLLEGVGHAGAFDHDPALYTLRAVEFFDEALRVRLASSP